MCGIVGFTGKSEAPLLRRMTEAVRHRGPDGSGFLSAGPGPEPCVHFGHRRLVVIDREGGAQPMRTRDGRWMLAFNGEIYNHQELRGRLASEGVPFETRSDTEVLLQALAHWGAEALPRLDGMFAFAAFDTVGGRLLLAIDRFGQKPLVWTLVRDDRLVFASELTALRCHPAVSDEWDTLAVCRMLAFDAPPAPQTMLKGVSRLEPGTLLDAVVRPDGGVAAWHVSTWWSAASHAAPHETPTQAGVIDALRQSVRNHLVSDVPLGVLLSGGVDSTAVAALAAEDRSIVTLSMGFREGEYDEAAQAREAARVLHTDHHEFQLLSSAAIGTLESVVRHMDEPLADAGCLPAWELYREVRGIVTVAIGGDGGDELLEGYPTYRALGLARPLSAIPRPLVRAAAWAAARLVPVTEGYYPLGYQIRRFLAGLEAEEWYRLPVYTGGCGVAMLRSVLRPEVIEQAGLSDPRDAAARLYEPAWPRSLREATAAPDTDAFAVWSHLRTYLAGEVLRKVDRMSMAHGLEVRAPMLGSPFAEMCLAAPSALRRRRGVGKLPLRRWLAQTPLAAAAWRPKRGFAIPVTRWLRRDFREVADRVFLDPASPLWRFCLPGPVADLWRAHRDGREDARKELWALLTLGLWLGYHERPQDRGEPSHVH